MSVASQGTRPVPAATRWAGWGLAVVPVLFLIPVAWAFGGSLLALLGTSEPDLGLWPNSVVADARAIYTGETLYQDPADGHTGLLYTPLQALIVGLLHHVAYWSGWGPLVSGLASAGIAGVAAAVAFRPTTSPRWLAVVEAAGIGALGWWLMRSLQFDMAFTGLTDQLAWLFALSGLVLVPAATRARGRPGVVVVALFTAAFWTKQSTAVAAVAAVLWLVALAAGGGVGWKVVARFALVLAAVNLALLAVVNLLTGGWEFYFNFELALDRPNSPESANRVAYLKSLERELRSGVGVTVLIAAATWLAVLVARRPRPGPPRTWLRALRVHAAAPPTVQLAVLLVLFLLLDLPAYVSLHRVPGTFDNQALGIVWGLVLLFAAGYRIAAARPLSAIAVGAVLLMLWLVAVAVVPRKSTVLGMSLTRITAQETFNEVPPDVIEYARTHLVWHPSWSYLNARPQGVVYPNQTAVGDLLAVGRPSGYLERALLERRFDAAASLVTAPPESENSYFSGNGNYEENYWLKLQAMLQAKYDHTRPIAGGHLWPRRAGPDAAAWMNRCFGPFSINGRDWRINKGGGFFCHESSTLHLRQAFADYADVRTDDRVHPRGTVGFDLITGGTALVAFEGGGEPLLLEAKAAPGAPIEFTARQGERVVRSRAGQATDRTRFRLRIQPGQELRLGGGAGEQTLSIAGDGPWVMRLGATRDSDAHFDLRSLEL